MVKHIVFFTLKETALGQPKAANAQAVKKTLEALVGRIPGLLKLEVGINGNKKETSADLAIYAELTDWAALEVYQNHPDHLEAAKFIGQVREGRWAVDWKV